MKPVNWERLWSKIERKLIEHKVPYEYIDKLLVQAAITRNKYHGGLLISGHNPKIHYVIRTHDIATENDDLPGVRDTAMNEIAATYADRIAREFHQGYSFFKKSRVELIAENLASYARFQDDITEDLFLAVEEIGKVVGDEL